MQIHPVITVPVTDAVTTAFSVGRNIALNLEGSYRKQVFEYENFTVIVDVKKDKAFVIVTGAGGFVGHPRTGDISKIPFFDNQMNKMYITGIDGGGFYLKNGSWEEIANRTVYPITDNDKGTFLIGEDVDWLADTDNYGNCFWTDGESTISWKSNPNYYFPLDHTFNIPGLSVAECELGGNLYYTCFSNNIYEQGAFLTKGPVVEKPEYSSIYENSLIAGAWYINGILCCCSVINRADTVGGYWLGFYRQENSSWILIGQEYPTSKLKTPAFISKTGLRVVHDDCVYEINEDLSSVSKTKLDIDSTGVRDITNDGRFYYTSAGSFWCGLDSNDSLMKSVITTNAEFKHTTFGSSANQTKLIPVYRGNPATSINLVKIDGSTYLVDANGSFCSISTSVTGNIHVSSVDGSLIKLTSPVGCGTLSATILPQGLAASINIIGNVVLVDSVESSCNYSIAGYGYKFNNNGYTKVYWAVSEIPINIPIISISTILGASASYTKACSGCHNSTPYTAYDYPVPTSIYANKYLNYNGLKYISGYSTRQKVCTGTDTNYSRGTILLNPSIPTDIHLIFSTSGDIYCVDSDCGYCTKIYEYIVLSLADTSFCSDYLDDGYLVGLTDYDRNPITVPSDNGTYFYKAVLAEEYVCQ